MRLASTVYPLSLAALDSSPARGEPFTEVSMKEYKIVQVVLPEQCEQTMNHLAKEGWVVHSFVSQARHFVIVFERDLPA